MICPIANIHSLQAGLKLLIESGKQPVPAGYLYAAVFENRLGLREMLLFLTFLRRSLRTVVRNDGDVIRQWACEGRGVILRSEWDVADDLAKGKLVRLLSGWKAPDADVMALTHQRAGLPARTRHFMQYLQSRFRPQPPWRR